MRYVGEEEVGKTRSPSHKYLSFIPICVGPLRAFIEKTYHTYRTYHQPIGIATASAPLGTYCSMPVGGLQYDTLRHVRR
jgi:hypothetical protein